jgi:hypothetical protein
MPDPDKDAQEFLDNMESGQFDGKLSTILHTFSCQQLLALARILIERYPLPSQLSTIESASDAVSTDNSSQLSTTKTESGER